MGIPESESLLFLIFSLLPTDTLVRLKSVCRLWAKVISHPTIGGAHCSRPTPIAAFFTLNTQRPDYRTQSFNKLTPDVKLPGSLSSILLDNFKAVSGNHGLLCFRRETTFMIGNPVTSQWVVIRDTIPCSGYGFHGAVLLYDPKKSLHFRVAVAMARLDDNDKNKHHIRFHIYSSENSSWAVSSEKESQLGRNVYRPSKIGGGSVCRLGESGSLIGYEIATDTYWNTQPYPPVITDFYKCVSEYNGVIYYMTGGIAPRVWKLEEKQSWVLLGECISRRSIACPLAYDDPRRAVILAVGEDAEVIAVDLTSSRAEVLCPIMGRSLANAITFHHMLHANTLAPLYIADQ